ncbi:hypothetical protein L208DRAFT_1392466 [Tricholoma matsutake]|nr:hypothetical protein L208DRAFT_1392466 [Tricholoma matsutake 945]
MSESHNIDETDVFSTNLTLSFGATIGTTIAYVPPPARAHSCSYSAFPMIFGPWL